ncbi:hypothetical protein [Streptomyces sp. NPDC060027]|uniref:hypothetical protein n=1 Tax=Streptomyces sp. NPDC060027 TaxID=3347040 RepID=UPI0036773357
MLVPSLADDIMMLAMHPDEPRDLLNHYGIADALRLAEILDGVLVGAELPTYRKLMWILRFEGRATLPRWLEAVVGNGRAVAQRPGLFQSKQHQLLDSASRTAAQGRLYQGLGGRPPGRSAALATLVGTGQLMSWAAGPGDLVAPMNEAASRLARGEVAPIGLPPQTLPHFAQVLDKAILLKD